MRVSLTKSYAAAKYARLLIFAPQPRQGAKVRQKSEPEKQPAEGAIKDIRRATRRHFSAEEEIRVGLEAPRRGEHRRTLSGRA
jgi:hypothetical protein